jgi:(p)ppGpp synthase/HD superfamily hydrolase
MQEGIRDENILKAALLHDVVENTQISIDHIKNKFGKIIATYIQQLSEDKSKTWEERKLNDIYHLDTMPIEIKWIKLADKVNNLEMIF